MFIICLFSLISLGVITTKPLFPQPPVYPDAVNIQVSPPAQVNLREISFQSRDDSNTILDYYAATLPRYGWDPYRRQPHDSYQRFGYSHGSYRAAFDLYVQVDERNDKTSVILRLVADGPGEMFHIDAPHWQWGTPVPRPEEE
jgi:hypothetical protein